MSIRVGKAVWIVLASAILLVVGIAVSLMVLEGLAPRAKARIELVAPLYPYNYTYVYVIDVFLGRGLYIVSLDSQASIEACIFCNNHTLSVRVGKGEERVFGLECDTGSLHAIIKAYMEPYSVKAGVLRVARRWR